MSGKKEREKRNDSKPEQQPISNTSNITSDKPSIFKRFLRLIFQQWSVIVGLIIAIGAYSKESIIIQLLFPGPTYSVSTTASLNPEYTNSIIGYRKFVTTGIDTVLNPLCSLIGVDIRNNTDESKDINNILLEYKNKGGKWTPLHCLRGGQDLLTDFMSRKIANQVTNIDNILDKLSSASLQPKQIFSGWLLVESTKEDLQVYKPEKLRLRINAKFSKEEYVEFELASGKFDGESLRGSPLTVKGGFANVLNYKIMNESEAIEIANRNLANSPVNKYLNSLPRR